VIQVAIYITGDCHSDFRKFNTKNFPEQKDLTKSDYVIICGDFGGVWDNSKYSNYWLDWLNNKSFTTLFIDGNHENFDKLYSFDVSEWHGGNVHFIKSTVIHLMRGQIFSIDGKKFFTFGGASSHDISDGIFEPDDPKLKIKIKRACQKNGLFRINHKSWWKEELPSVEEINAAKVNLGKYNNEIDYIITHCLSTCTQNYLQEKAQCHVYEPDILTDFLDEVQLNCKYKHWYSGHYHLDLQITDIETILYDKIIKIE